MRNRIIQYITAVVLSMFVSACTDDLTVTTDNDLYNQFDEGELIETTIGINVRELCIGEQDSRFENPALNTDEATLAEKKIDNIWVFQFDASGNKLIRPRYYTISDQSELSNLKVFLKGNTLSTICVVTNTGDESWINREYPPSYQQLVEMNIPNPSAQYSDSNLAIPMWGEKNNVTIDISTTEEIDVERMFARLDIRLDLQKETLSLQTVEINKIPFTCRVSSRFTTGSAAAEYPQDTYWVTRTWDVSELPVNPEGGYNYVSIYIPESIQGEVPGLTSQEQKFANAPALALKVNFHVIYTEPETEAESEYTYTVYPGGNYYNNYNIRRNCTYHVIVTVQHDDDAKHSPSSNCIVTSKNKTISFEPYFRVESGGNYNIKDYLDDEDTTGEKVIEYVKIIWQTTDRVDPDSTPDRTLIGDNSGYDKVWYNKTNEKIYVKTRGYGNALIAAYNKYDKIIWSWHIWSTKIDPKNIDNAVIFTTFDWDNSGVHANKARVPGYAVMKCNLGAMDDDPNNYSWFQTWGMYYQWGRKDPFPPVKTPTGSYYDWMADNLGTPDGRAPGRTHPYDKRYVTAIFDNSNQKITGITEQEQTDNELFYSYSVWKSGETDGITDSDKGVRYSIAHPTVFMCGDDKPGFHDLTDPYHGESCNEETGDWLPEPDNTLWGGLEPKEVAQYYKIPGSAYNTIYQNYGTQKSIFDPCPAGWRVPPDNLWLSFTKTGLNPTMLYPPVMQVAQDVNFDPTRNIAAENNNQGPGVWMYMQAWRTGPSLFFPVQGVRRPRGHITRVLMCGSYLSASVGQPIDEEDLTKGNWLNSLHMHYPRTTLYDKLYFMVFEYANSIYRSKSTAGAVRCVRDTY